jgi:hypothetical protein
MGDDEKVIDLLMQVGTALGALATLPQILAVFKNRDSLKGYNSPASFCLFLAMVAFAVAFYLMNNWFSAFCEIPVAVFWLMAAVYSMRKKQ